MSQSLLPISSESRSAVSSLFENAPAVLVEVRFPGCGTSPDWYLCDEEEQLDKILDRLAQGTEVHLSDVQDLKNAKGAICFRK
jgi:hypothetical protein